MQNGAVLRQSDARRESPLPLRRRINPTDLPRFTEPRRTHPSSRPPRPESCRPVSGPQWNRLKATRDARVFQARWVSPSVSTPQMVVQNTPESRQLCGFRRNDLCTEVTRPGRGGVQRLGSLGLAASSLFYGNLQGISAVLRVFQALTSEIALLFQASTHEIPYSPEQGNFMHRSGKKSARAAS